MSETKVMKKTEKTNANTAAVVMKKSKDQKPAPSPEREAAKRCGLTLVHYQILKALSKAPAGLTYRGIEKKTGYYSILTAQLRKESSRGHAHSSSLSSLGLVHEEIHDHNGTNILSFRISAKGKKVLQAGLKPTKSY